MRLYDILSARRPSWGRHLSASAALPADLAVTIRPAYPDDDLALSRLAALDSAPVPAGFVMLAEVSGELWAAVSVDTEGAVADPFRPSAELLLALHERAQRLRRAARRRSGRASMRARPAGAHAVSGSEHRADLHAAGGPGL